MIRLSFRLLALAALGVAVFLAVVDATRSVAASSVVVTPLGQSWQAAAPGSFAWVRGGFEAALPAFLWDPVATSILALPGFAVFLAIALVFTLTGRGPERPLGRLAGPGHPSR